MILILHFLFQLNHLLTLQANSFKCLSFSLHFRPLIMSFQCPIIAVIIQLQGLKASLLSSLHHHYGYLHLKLYQLLVYLQATEHYRPTYTHLQGHLIMAIQVVQVFHLKSYQDLVLLLLQVNLFSLPIFNLKFICFTLVSQATMQS